MSTKKKYCDNPLCEAEAIATVPVSVNMFADSKRNYCGACEDVYQVGVQHGNMKNAQLIEALKNAVESLAVCADDSEEAGYPDRAESVRKDLESYRAALKKAGVL